MAAYAQAAACARIDSLLAAIESAPQYLNYSRLEGQVQRARERAEALEFRFSSVDCATRINAFGAAGWQCQNLARSIAEARATAEQMSRDAQDGRSLARQRESLLADHRRAGCRTTTATSRALEQFSASPDAFQTRYDTLPEPAQPRQALGPTRRSVCVRTCDGYFWPISFSTTEQHLHEDANACVQQCPGAEVALFSYRNPGQTPDDMVSLSGQSYRSMPYAFRYRESYDSGCSCRAQPLYGTLPIPEQSQALIPLELPEIEVPLPRPRPGAQPPEAPAARVVQFGERRVRIVGPETPYVPEEAGPS